MVTGASGRPVGSWFSGYGSAVSASSCIVQSKALWHPRHHMPFSCTYLRMRRASCGIRQLNIAIVCLQLVQSSWYTSVSTEFANSSTSTFTAPGMMARGGLTEWLPPCTDSWWGVRKSTCFQLSIRPTSMTQMVIPDASGPIQAPRSRLAALVRIFRRGSNGHADVTILKPVGFVFVEYGCKQQTSVNASQPNTPVWL